MSTGGKTSFLFTLQSTSSCLTSPMMEEMGIHVDEIVSSYDSIQNVYYAYIHTAYKVRDESFEMAMSTLASTHNIRGSIDNGHKSITSSVVKTSQMIEDHPGFRMLVKHEENENPTFKRWADETNHPKTTFGYKRLKSKLRSKGAINAKGIYVLRVDNRPRPFFYVGKAENIEKRIEQHQNGTGAYCITGEPFTRVEPVTKGSTENLGSWERDEVLARMYEFGIDNVRGWMYTLKTMPLEQKLSAFDQICESYDLCRECGRGTHFIRECGAVSTDRWTGGMEIRSKYNVLSSMDQQTTELDDAVAECRRAEAALANA
jgi:hypothetical protein